MVPLAKTAKGFSDIHVLNKIVPFVQNTVGLLWSNLEVPMKKIAVLLNLFLLVMSSCSKSEESGKQPAPRQPKRPNICVTESPDDSNR